MICALIPADATLAQTSADPPMLAGIVQRQGPCVVEGPAARFAPTLDDFGHGGEAYPTRQDASYFDARGYLFGFERASAEAFRADPWGGYLVGGIVLGGNREVAARDTQAAIHSWTATWSRPEPIDIGVFGEETVAFRRVSPWEIDQDQPMIEIFVAFRYCNASVHFMLATMPEFDAVGQAKRYSAGILQRMQ